MNLTGRTVLLTGATGGIGHAIAERLHEAGATLTISGRRADVLEPLAARLSATAVAADLADRNDVARLADACSDVDVLVANAALPAAGDLRSFDVDQIDRALDVNLRAPIVLTRLLAERMAQRGSGHIVLVSSLAGRATSAGGSLYSATKFGLRGFGQSLRLDLQDEGVGISVVFPGFIRDAGMFHESGAALPHFVRTSSPQDVARGVVRAIEQNRGEVTVAPFSMRAGTKLAELAPTVAAQIAMRIGGARLAQELQDGQAAKR